jgi:hypothetical protein
MRKGLILTLTIAAIALVGVSPIYAFAPVIGGIPDIVVGDQEDFNGTVDSNFFRFSNAINFLSYVSDADTVTTAIRWSFMEADASNSMTINTKVQLSGSENPVSPPSGKELTAAGTKFWADFRITKLSPLAGSPPFPSPGVTSGTVAFNRLITLFASDGSLKDSKTIVVYAVENGFDRLSKSAQQVYSENFNSGNGGWGFSSFDAVAEPNNFSGATSSVSGGRIGLASPSNSSNYYGSWAGGTTIPYQANKVYRARWTMLTDQGTASAVPGAQFRLFSSSFADTGTFGFNSGGGQNLNQPPVSPASRTYNQYWKPADLSSIQSNTATAGIKSAFDILDFSATVSGSLFLDAVTIETLDEPTLGTSDANITTFTAAQWGYLGGSALFGTWQDAASAGIGTGNVSLTVAGSATKAVGLLTGQAASSPPSIPVVTDQLYRATFTLHRGATDVASASPVIRLRLQATETSSARTIANSSNGVAVPGTSASNYNVYIVGQSFTGGAPSEALSFDYYSFDGNATGGESGTETLTGVTVNHGAQP